MNGASFPRRNVTRIRYYGFICNKRTLSGKNTDQRRDDHNQGWNQSQHQCSFFEPEVHEISHDECGLYERQSHQEHEHHVHRKLNIRQKNFDAGENQQPRPNRQSEFAVSPWDSECVLKNCLQSICLESKL